MTDPTFNLAQLTQRPNWYDFLAQAEVAMAHQNRVDRLRYAAGWTCDEGGWSAPCGTHESDWADEARPFPEDAEFCAWASAYYHYDAADAGVPDPFPPAPAA